MGVVQIIARPGEICATGLRAMSAMKGLKSVTTHLKSVMSSHFLASPVSGITLSKVLPRIDSSMSSRNQRRRGNAYLLNITVRTWAWVFTMDLKRGHEITKG